MGTPGLLTHFQSLHSGIRVAEADSAVCDCLVISAYTWPPLRHCSTRKKLQLHVLCYAIVKVMPPVLSTDSVTLLKPRRPARNFSLMHISFCYICCTYTADHEQALPSHGSRSLLSGCDVLKLDRKSFLMMQLDANSTVALDMIHDLAHQKLRYLPRFPY